MASGQDGDAGNQQQDEARTARPEEIWLDHIRENYPNLQQETYFFPPLYPNHASFAVDNIGELPVPTDPSHQLNGSASEVPPQGLQQSTASASKKKKKRKKKVPPSSTSQAPGMYIENPEDLKDDQAQQQCLSALRDIPGQPMVVVSQLHFRKYLDNETNPERLTNPFLQTAIQLLPNLGSLPVKLQDGEYDILIIHRRYGLILGEIIGSHTQPPDNEAIVKRVEKAVQQLRNQQQALAHLVKDLATPGSIRITRTLMLPNLSDAQLTSALNSSGEVKEALCQTLSNSSDFTQAREHCVCEEDLQQVSQWWNDLHGQGPDPCMTSDLYERLVARFCGPATTVEIPTACTPRKAVVRSQSQAATETSSPQPPEVVVRSQGQAATETSSLLRFSALALTASQVVLLGEKPEPRYLYLQGPPGTGKTMVLILKALQWAQRQMKVVIITQPRAKAGISMLIERQLIDLLGETAATIYIQRHCCNFDERLNVRADVARLLREHGPGCAILCDEIPIKIPQHFISWLKEVRNTCTEAVVWMAGVWTRDSTVHTSLHLPPWVAVRTLKDPLRCPPVITRALQDKCYMGSLILPYAPPAQPVHREGPPVQLLWHFQEPGHSRFSHPVLCTLCTNEVAVILNQLHVGQPGQPLQYRDVWILSDEFYDPREPFMVQHLRDHYGIPIVTIQGNPLGEADAQELALAVTDQIILTHYWLVRGLERKIVISVGPGVHEFAYLPVSRSTNRLICID